ncbi:hypothetical protein FH972_001482 [Carpinus fangiana]|uniref:Uncharacterized protein n=1 Tax=Carpinus fangiana TaxID=176857 RepID=A0A5N6QE84_9ROSI|nr:hypothetical protein FH972_001482 [Carpinus fangiana]
MRSYGVRCAARASCEKVQELMASWKEKHTEKVTWSSVINVAARCRNGFLGLDVGAFQGASGILPQKKLMED